MVKDGNCPCRNCPDGDGGNCPEEGLRAILFSIVQQTTTNRVRSGALQVVRMLPCCNKSQSCKSDLRIFKGAKKECDLPFQIAVCPFQVNCNILFISLCWVREIFIISWLGKNNR